MALATAHKTKSKRKTAGKGRKPEILSPVNDDWEPSFFEYVATSTLITILHQCDIDSLNNLYRTSARISRILDESDIVEIAVWPVLFAHIDGEPIFNDFVKEEDRAGGLEVSMKRHFKKSWTTSKHPFREAHWSLPWLLPAAAWFHS